MSLKIKFKRGTKAQLDTAAGSNQLEQGEPYLITDQNRLAIGLTASTYETYAKESEAGGGGGLTLASEITAATTLTAASASKYIPVNSATAINITIDPNVFAQNDQFVIEQTGAGVVTLVAGSGMTLNGNLNSMGQYYILTIFFKSATVATVIGGEA